MATRRRWYTAQGGVHFKCTQCGACCSREGSVLVYRDEAKRIAPRYRPGAKPADLAGGLWTWNDFYDSWMIEIRKGGKCPFLINDKCTIHDIKPRQCATYPFWDEVVDTEETWREEALLCEGINNEEKLYPPDLIEMIKREQQSTYENRRR